MRICSLCVLWSSFVRCAAVSSLLAFLSPARSTPALAKEHARKGARPRSQKSTPALQRSKGEGPQGRGPARERARKGARSTRAHEPREGLCASSSKEAQGGAWRARFPPSSREWAHGPHGPRLGEARAHWGHGPLSKKIEYFEWRRLTARFNASPVFILSKRAYTYGLRQSARIVFRFP